MTAPQQLAPVPQQPPVQAVAKSAACGWSGMAEMLAAWNEDGAGRDAALWSNEPAPAWCASAATSPA